MTTQTQKNHISFGHLGVIAAGVLVLGLITYVKQPQLFSMKAAAENKGESNVPTYFAYEKPVDDSAQVAGASTAATDGPSVLNEDGSISGVSTDMGDVLGVTTEDVNANLDTVIVGRAIPDTDESIKAYIQNSSEIESTQINSTEFEQALTSNDQVQIDAQSEKMKSIISRLQAIPVPSSFVTLQKLKILQYQAAINTLEHFTKADEEPELVSQYLGYFLQAQQQLESESTKLTSQFKLNEIE